MEFLVTPTCIYKSNCNVTNTRRHCKLVQDETLHWHWLHVHVCICAIHLHRYALSCHGDVCVEVCVHYTYINFQCISWCVGKCV